MSLRTSVIAASGIALAAALLPGIAAAPQEKPGRGARVAIAAFHDSRLFTLCPAYGKDVIESNVWTSKMAAKVTVFYPPTGGSRSVSTSSRTVTPGSCFRCPRRLHVTDFGRASASVAVNSTGLPATSVSNGASPTQLARARSTRGRLSGSGRLRLRRGKHLHRDVHRHG